MNPNEDQMDALNDEVRSLRKENAALREALEFYASPCDATETSPCGYEDSQACCKRARAALQGAKDD